MGIIDKWVDGVKSKLPEGVREKIDGTLPSADHNAVLGIATTLLEHVGGLQGVVGRLESHGLGDIARSWTGKGDNLPISSEQIRSALGNDTVSHLAGQLGIDTETLSQKLSHYLPLLVDHLTPDGQMPKGALSKEQLLSTAMGLFKQRQ